MFSRQESALSLPRVSRRDFLQLGLGYIGYEALLFAGLLKESERIAVHHYIYRDAALSANWDKTIVVQISDLHIGKRDQDPVDPDNIRELAIQIQEYLEYIGADPHKTFLFDTGDAVSVIAKDGKESNIGDLTESLEFLSFIQADHKYAVAGNHDTAHSRYAEIATLYRSSGFVYADEVGLVLPSTQLATTSNQPFLVVTAPDFTTHRGNWYKSEEAEQFLSMLEAISPEQLTMILTHNPSMVDVWRDGKVAHILEEKKAILFSGHTHGGQLNTASPVQSLAMYAGRELKHYDSKLIKGVHRIGSSFVNVNTGFGYSKGVRTLPPSFDVFELRSGT